MSENPYNEPMTETMTDGPNTHKPDAPFWKWAILEAFDDNGNRHLFHVPADAIPVVVRTEPRTDAGRRLLAGFAYACLRRPSLDGLLTRYDVLAIEAEAAVAAAVAARAEVAKLVRALWQDDRDDFDDRSVLALLQPVAPPEPDPA